MSKLRELVRALKAPPDGHPFYGNQWTGGGGGGTGGTSVTAPSMQERTMVYHGTSRQAADSIMREGLKVGKKSYFGRPPALYATDDFQVAMNYALATLRETEGEFVVFSTDRNEGNWDQDKFEASSFMTTETVSPERLLGYAIYHANLETGIVELVEQNGEGVFPDNPYPEEYAPFSGEKAKKRIVYLVVVTEK
jgi:hypothetical protein